MGLTTIVGTAFRLLDISGGLVIITVSLSTLACFYYMFSFALFNDIRLRDIFKKTSYSNTSPKRIIVAIGLGSVISNVIIGSLFKTQVWPGSDPILKVGLPILGLILIVLLSRYYINKTDLNLKAFHVRAIKRILIYGGLGLILYLIPSSTFINAFNIQSDEVQSIEEVTSDTNVDEAEPN